MEDRQILCDEKQFLLILALKKTVKEKSNWDNSVLINLGIKEPECTSIMLIIQKLEKQKKNKVPMYPEALHAFQEKVLRCFHLILKTKKYKTPIYYKKLTLAQKI